MKKAFPVILLSALIVIAADMHAQVTDSLPLAVIEAPASPQVERARISAERSELEAELSVAEAGCYKNFFVNNCLEKVKSRRDAVMGVLKRQEVILNAQDRKAKGAEQILRTEEKSSLESVQRGADKRNAAVEELRLRVERDVQKTENRAEVKASEQANREAAAQRLEKNQEKAAARSARQAAATDAVNKSNQRLQQARERRLRHEREMLERTKPQSNPLPVPP